MDRFTGLLVGTAVGDSLGLPREGLSRRRAGRKNDLGLNDGVTGYVHHTVPVCLHAWLRSPRDFERAVGDVVLLGGDSDTTGAIVGALAGASAGEGAIPGEWLAIIDFPRSLAWIRTLADRLSSRSAPLRLWWPAVPLRNAVFAAVVLAIGFRRLLPPFDMESTGPW